MTNGGKRSTIVTMVLSPKKLWESYDRKIMPLETSVVSTKDTSFGSEKRVYFNGEATSVGCTRIYARLLLPKEKTGSVILVMLPPEHDIHDIDVTYLLEKNWAVLLVDYAGNINDRMRFTMYPAALSFANYDETTLYEPTENPQKTCWYVWATVCLRSITYAEEEGFVNVSALGIGLGGSHVYKAAAIDDKMACAAAVYSPGFFPKSENAELSSIGLEVEGYSPLLKVPFLQLCCSNDDDARLDDISDLVEQSQQNNALRLTSQYDSVSVTVPGVLYIAPRVDRSFTSEMQNDLLVFFDHHLSDKKNTVLTPTVSLTAYGSDNKLYFSIKCERTCKDVVLYISHGVTNPAYRNWRTLPIERIGEAEYLGHADVYSVDKPIFMFATFTTEQGFMFSTPVQQKTPASMRILPATIVKRRLIYESEMGIDDFFSGEVSSNLYMKKGPFEIDGIAGKQVCTYKIGDEAYSGYPDSVLQLLLFSPVEQNITFSVIDEYQFKTYTCTKHVTPQNDWSKLMLSVSDFRSSDGPFIGWNSAIFLQIGAEEEFIVSSLLWV